MGTVKLNGVIVDRNADLTGKEFSNGQLNTMLGTDGAPRYSANQLKSVNKTKLADQVRELINEIPEKVVRAKGEGKGAKPRVSKTKAVAQSKLCNTLKALAVGKKTVDQAIAIYEFDTVLAEYIARDLFMVKVNAAIAGERPKSARQTVTIQVELDEAEVAA
jgi:hypothetical protein